MRTEVHGIAASPGVAIATAHVVPRPGRARRTRTDDRAQEAGRLRDAIERSRAEIEEARHSADDELGLVLDAQLLMHRDELLVEAAVRRILERGMGAEWALEATVSELKAPLLAAPTPYFRERAQDIEHVGQHILRHLRGDDTGRLALPGATVVLLGEDLSPADALRLLGTGGVRGIATEIGTYTSHTAILARAFGVPAVLGVPALLASMRADADRIGAEPVLVDGLSGVVVLSPDPDERAAAEERAARYQRFALALRERTEAAPTTLDGIEVDVQANIERPTEASTASARGARGVGLYRTEFLYLEREQPPSEDEQAKRYREALDGCAGVTFRTFDLGGDKLPGSFALRVGANPALGLRATRLADRLPALLATQIRAVLRAAAGSTGAALMFPLVAGPDDFLALRARVDAERAALEAEGIEVGPLEVGAMVELPSAAVLAGPLARAADFLSVGTNDLVQYTLAVDRQNPDVAALADPMHPAVLRLLAGVVTAADAAGTPLAMCGDMAADWVALPVALGLGFRRISVPVSAMPFAQELVRRLHLGRASALAQSLLDGTSAVDARRAVRRALGPDLEDLWEELE